MATTSRTNRRVSSTALTIAMLVATFGVGIVIGHLLPPTPQQTHKTPPTPQPVSPLALTVEPDPLHVANLKLVLKNVSARNVTLFRGSLPWATHDSMLILGIADAPDGKPLPFVPPPIEDPWPFTINLKPGQELRGEIDLHRRLEGVVQALSRNDLFVFWTYKAESPDSDFPRIGGWLVIPQTRKNAHAK